MMFTKSYARILFLLALTLIVLISPSLINDSNNYMNDDSYFYSRISELKSDYDDLSYSGRDFTYSMGQISMFLFFKKFLPEKFIINIIPVIFGLISLLLFHLILKELYVEPNVNYLSLIILILSPPFIYIFTSYNIFTPTTLILLLIFYLFIQRDQMLNFVSYILFFIIPFFGYQYAILALSLLLIYCMKEKMIKKFYIIFIITLISLSIVYLPYLSKYGLSEPAGFDRVLNHKLLFSDLGSSFGISIFIVFLSVFGLRYLWKSKYKYLPVYISLILSMLSIYYYPKFIIYLNFILSFLAALGIIYLLRSKWESETIRKLTMWLLIIGVVFSTITFVNEISKQDPNKNLYDALIYLRNYDNSKDVVFSHYSYGILINTIANKKNVMDNNFLYAPDLNERHQNSQALFYTRNFNTASDIIDNYNIKYILITKKMKDGLIWNEKDEGLLFLLNSANIYKKIYNNDEVEIWRIIE